MLSSIKCYYHTQEQHYCQEWKNFMFIGILLAGYFLKTPWKFWKNNYD